MKRFILLIILLTTACGISPDQQSILDKSSCVFPCWNGIIPGQTTEAEFLEILETLPNIDIVSIQNENRPWNIFDNQIFFSYQEGGIFTQRTRIEGELRISNNTVSDLILCEDINVSIGDLVEQVGEPEHIISGNNNGGGRTVILTNSQNGISYWYTTSLNDLEITSDTPIDCVKIFNPLLYEKMLDAGFFSNGDYNADETLRVWYPWNGYGNLDEKYPPRQP